MGPLEIASREFTYNHLGKRKIIDSKVPFWGDIFLVSRRVALLKKVAD